MKYNENYKVEFKTVPWAGNDRYVYYRIVPSELIWWKRIFGNPWRLMFHAFNTIGGTIPFFEPKEYNKNIRPLETFGDVCKYLNGELKKSEINAEKDRIKWEKDVKNGEAWPD